MGGETDPLIATLEEKLGKNPGNWTDKQIKEVIAELTQDGSATPEDIMAMVERKKNPSSPVTTEGIGDSPGMGVLKAMVQKIFWGD